MSRKRDRFALDDVIGIAFNPPRYTQLDSNPISRNALSV